MYTFMVNNLLSNALKYTKPGGEINIVLKDSGTDIQFPHDGHFTPAGNRVIAKALAASIANR